MLIFHCMIVPGVDCVTAARDVVDSLAALGISTRRARGQPASLEQTGHAVAAGESSFVVLF